MSVVPARSWRPPSPWGRRWIGVAAWSALAAFLVWNVLSLEIDASRVTRGLSRLGTVASKAFPPNFERLELLATGVWESVEMATLATLFGVVLGIPVAVLAARNVVPLPVYAGGRLTIALARTFHELIIAIIFVKAVGFGMLAGVLTLTLSSLASFSKLLAEEIETIDRGQIEAIRATGASSAKVLIYGVLPQVLPRIVGLTIYKWDINLRQSTIIGIVGAGGIGATLNTALSRYEYDTAAAVLIIIIAIVMFAEYSSSLIRKRIQ